MRRQLVDVPAAVIKDDVSLVERQHLVGVQRHHHAANVGLEQAHAQQVSASAIELLPQCAVVRVQHTVRTQYMYMYYAPHRKLTYNLENLQLNSNYMYQ